MNEGTPLVALPSQPDDVPWPTGAWPTGPLPHPGDVEALVDDMMGNHSRYGTTYAVVIVKSGRLVAERYGGEIPHWDRSDEPVTPDTPLLSWSIAKSVLHAAIGILVRDGRVDLEAPVPVPAWSGDDDPRRAITLEDLLAMRDGLGFTEDYVDDRVSDVIDMLFGSGRDDVAAYATSRSLAHSPGSTFNYSSGTSNVVARILGDTVGGGPPGVEQFLREELFGPVGMTSARPRFDAAGTFVGSTFLYATARDLARFGLLYLRDGIWDGRRILPTGWVDHARRPRSADPTDGRWYGAHWWVVGDELGGFWANGYEGQAVLCVPALDLIVVRMGRTTADNYDHLVQWRAAVTAVFSAS
jgi:CubicO group peptidase (beta-lactamase class C family)